MNRVRWVVLLGFLVIALTLPVAAADDEGGEEEGGNGNESGNGLCDPVIIGIEYDLTTDPPTIEPKLAVRPECLH